MILFAALSAFCQFWVLSGTKADSISRIIFERYAIMPDEVPKFTHFPDKKSQSYLEQDSMKREYKRDSVRINFKEVIPRKVRDKYVYTFLVESPESEEVELSLDSVILSPGSHLYFVGKNFYEFGGPVTAESLKKGFKRLMNTSAFESSGIYVTATFSVIRDADNPTNILTDSRSYKVWLDGPFMSVTNITTNHTSTGYYMNMAPSVTNNFHFNYELSEVTSVNWSFPSGWGLAVLQGMTFG